MRTRAFLAGLIICVFLFGCGSAQEKEDLKGGESPRESKGIEETVDMTDEEKKLLCEIYPMEERIREGRLYDYQKDALDAFRAGMEHLSGKYPGYSFEALSITPATKFDPWMIVRIQSGDSGVWELKVTPEKGEYSFADTFYNVPLAGDYDRLLGEMLEDSGFGIRSHTEFTALRDNVGPDTTAEEILQMGRDLPKMTHLYIEDPGDAEKREEAAKAVQTALQEAGAGGAYILYFAPWMHIGSTDELEAKRLEMESAAFNV